MKALEELERWIQILEDSKSCQNFKSKILTLFFKKNVRT